MKYDATLIAHTPEPRLEAGVPVCYLNERGRYHCAIRQI